MVYIFDGERLRELRKGKGLIQKELAAIVGVSARSITAYERGISTPDDSVKLKFAHYFDVSLDYLMGNSDESSTHSRKDILILPKDYPLAARAELIEYAKYLHQKHKK